MAKNQTEKPLDYYKRRTRYLRRRFGDKFNGDFWVGGECCTGDDISLQEYEVMTAPGRWTTLYVLYYVSDSKERILAVYDDALVAYEVSRIAHEVYPCAFRVQAQAPQV